MGDVFPAKFMLLTDHHFTSKLIAPPSSQKLNTFEKGGNALQVLNSFASVFLILNASTDEEETRIYNQINALMKDNPISRHRYLFYESNVSKIAMVRQLKPQIHIDYEATICIQIAPHVKSVLHINEIEKDSKTTTRCFRTIDGIEELILL
jgi:hypothetical protein